MGLRDIAQVLLVLAAQHDDAKQYVRDYASGVMSRADEPKTVVAVHNTLYGERTTLPKPLKKGINDALHQFDEYQFSKYQNSRREVKFRDVINRTHPKPRDEEHEELFETLIYGDLENYPDVDPLEAPKTWEVEISEKGNTAEAWRDVLDDMGLFGRIRNVRNMLEAGLDGEEIFGDVDMNWVRNSKLSAFRFYQSYKAVKDAGLRDRYVEDWLSDAVDVAAENLDDNLSDTFTAVDLSGSMDRTVSNKSNLERSEISALFGALMMRNGSETGGFGRGFQLAQAHHDTPTLELQDKIRRMDVGHSTNAHLAIRHLVDEGKEYSRVAVFTDEQLWNSYGTGDSLRKAWDDYRSEVAPEASLYVIDLASYGDLSMPEERSDVYQISGWNSEVLDFIENAENPGSVVEEISDR